MPEISVKVKLGKGKDIIAEVNKALEEARNALSKRSKNFIIQAINLMEAEVKTQKGWEYLRSSRGRGELGFSLTFKDPGEVLLRILRENSLQDSKVTRTGLTFAWGNISEMIKDPRLSHELTRITNGIEVSTGLRVNWFQWLEKGVDISGFNIITDKRFRGSSRSGKAVMRSGSTFFLKPTSLVEGAALRGQGRVNRYLKTATVSFLDRVIGQLLKRI